MRRFSLFLTITLALVLAGCGLLTTEETPPDLLGEASSPTPPPIPTDPDSPTWTPNVVFVSPTPTITPNVVEVTATQEGEPAQPTATSVPPTDEPPTATDIPPTELPTQAPPTAVPASPTPAPQANPANVEVSFVQVVSGFTMPTSITAVPGSDALVVTEREGLIRVVEDGTIRPEPFLDVRGQVSLNHPEQGLLNIAFHPDYQTNGRVFTYATAPNGEVIIVEWQTTPDRTRIDPSTASAVLVIPQPEVNHNGGSLVFGPDGFLYIGVGDGGAQGGIFVDGEVGETLLGNVLRIDVDGGDPYAIPGDNPFVSDPNTLDEIWAMGLRNPWSLSFDPATGDLWIADVGQNLTEEVNYQNAGHDGGRDYGWPEQEAWRCRIDNCDGLGHTLPVVYYDHDEGGCSVTGGHVYRGSQYPALSGLYFFSDFCSGFVWAVAQAEDGTWLMEQVAQSGFAVSTFGQGNDGEIYLVDYPRGTLYQLTGSAR